MKIGIPKEIHDGERRVAATPDTARKLQKFGFQVVIESGAGAAASFPDEAYRDAGCEITSDVATVWQQDIVAKVRPPEYHPGTGQDETEMLREGATLISFLWPGQNAALLERLVARKANAIAMDAVPRISRAQKLDALSSMANIAGYRAVVEAATLFPRFFTGQITAAGKVPPAKVLIIGAGVAGLAAIGAARGMGAIVRAFDTRPAVREQVQSMGAEFLEVTLTEDGAGEGGYAKEMSPAFIKAEMELFLAQAKDVDIIITTALIPGRPAPKLLQAYHVEAMRPGSVIVDLAAEQGGNCELTQPGRVAEHNGVKIIGYTDLASRLSSTASQLYGTNISHLLDDLGKAEKHHLDLNDEVTSGALVIHEGKNRWPTPKPKMTSPTENKPKEVAAPKKSSHGHGSSGGPGSPWPLVAAGLALIGIGVGAPPWRPAR